MASGFRFLDLNPFLLLNPTIYKRLGIKLKHKQVLQATYYIFIIVIEYYKQKNTS